MKQNIPKQTSPYDQQPKKTGTPQEGGFKKTGTQDDSLKRYQNPQQGNKTTTTGTPHKEGFKYPHEKGGERR